MAVQAAAGPPAPGIWCGDSDYTWVSGWYPAATELTILKKAYTSQKNRKFLCVFEIFERTSWHSKPPRSYFLYVGVHR